MKRTKKNREQKLHMDRQLLMKLEMAMIVVISVIAVTIAWFQLINSAWAKDLTLKAGSADYIKVALESGGKDVSELEEDQRYIDINMPNFYNVEKNAVGKTLMAPGVSGKLNLYITSLHPDVTSCRINAECIPVFESENAEGMGETEGTGLTEEQKALEKLVKGHIQFYRYYSEEDGYTGFIGETEYAGTLNGTDPQNATLTIDGLQQGVEQHVTIYWIWFYEYTDIPDEGKGRDDSGYYFDYNGKVSSLTTEEKVLYYDYGDTQIGLKVPELKFHIVVDALDESVSETGENNHSEPGGA